MRELFKTLIMGTAAGCLAVSGCTRPEGDIFPLIEPEIVYPPRPDYPRIRYVGEYRGSADLRPARTGLQVAAAWLNPEANRPVLLSRPYAVATGDDDRVYATDTGTASVHVIDLQKRTHIEIRNAGEERLRSPVGVAVARRRLFVSDSVLGAVYEYTVDGDFLGVVDVACDRPSGIHYCSEIDRLLVVDTNRHHVSVMAPNGERGGWSKVGVFGSRGSGPGKLNYPTFVTCHPTAGVLVSDTLNFRVQRFDHDGKWIASIGKKGNGAGDFALPKGVSVDQSHHLYVVDAQFENVQMFDPMGRLLMAFGEEGHARGEFAIPAGIAIDDRDRIWLADGYNRRLQVFEFIGGAE